MSTELIVVAYLIAVTVLTWVMYRKCPDSLLNRIIVVGFVSLGIGAVAMIYSVGGPAWLVVASATLFNIGLVMDLAGIVVLDMRLVDEHG